MECLLLLVLFLIVIGLVIASVKLGSNQLVESENSDMAGLSSWFDWRCKSICITRINSAGFLQNW